LVSGFVVMIFPVVLLTLGIVHFFRLPVTLDQHLVARLQYDDVSFLLDFLPGLEQASPEVG
jgi:hypothetical protein